MGGGGRNSGLFDAAIVEAKVPMVPWKDMVQFSVFQKFAFQIYSSFVNK